MTGRYACPTAGCWCRSSYAWPPGPPRILKGYDHTRRVMRWTPDQPALRFPPRVIR